MTYFFKKDIFIFLFLINSFSLKPMENQQISVSQYTYIIAFNICMKVYCSEDNDYGKNYLGKLSLETINDTKTFDFLKKPFVQNVIPDTYTSEYTFTKETINTLNQKLSFLYGIQLSCSGTVCTNGFGDRYYDYSQEDNLKFSFLELAIIAMLREHKIDKAFEKFQSELNHYLIKNDSTVPSLQAYLEKTICQALTYPTDQKIDHNVLLKKRYFPHLLLKPSINPAKDIAYELCDSKLFIDMLCYPGLVRTIKDDNAQVICERYDITITE